MEQGKTPNLPQRAGSATDDSFDRELQTKLAGVEGTVRDTVVKRIRRLVDADPKSFVNGLRRMLNDGRQDD